MTYTQRKIFSIVLIAPPALLGWSMDCLSIYCAGDDSHSRKNTSIQSPNVNVSIYLYRLYTCTKI